MLLMPMSKKIKPYTFIDLFASDLPEASGLKVWKRRSRSIGSRSDPQQKKMESCRDVGTDSNTKLVLKSYILKTDKFRIEG